MERAIVTQVPGTTRDALEEKIRLGDMILNIIDTAGIRNTEDIVEKIGVDRSREYASKADLIIWMIDGSRPLDEDDREILQLVSGKKAIILINKQDLPVISGKNEIRQMLLSDIVNRQSENGSGSGSKVTENSVNICSHSDERSDKQTEVMSGMIPIFFTSVKERAGIDEVVQKIKTMFYHKEINFNDQVYITNMRQKQSLSASLSSLDKAMESIRNQVPEDFYTIDLMDAYSHLGSVIGETLEDDLADEIFSKFCMGK